VDTRNKGANIYCIKEKYKQLPVEKGGVYWRLSNIASWVSTFGDGNV
jgi:hypothetical protein